MSEKAKYTLKLIGVVVVVAVVLRFLLDYWKVFPAIWTGKGPDPYWSLMIVWLVWRVPKYARKKFPDPTKAPTV